MTLPNFLVIGTMKAGTSSLHHALSLHPQVFLPKIKEIHFFGCASHNYAQVSDLTAYEQLYDGVTDEIAIGDATGGYLTHWPAIDDIEKYVPNALMIAMLRNPVDRAYSHYRHESNRYREDITNFAEAFWTSPHSQGYQANGMYYRNLRRFFERFPASQIRVFLFEDYVKQPDVILPDIFDFIGVDRNFVPAYKVLLRTGDPKSEMVQSFLRKPNNLRRLARLFLPMRIRDRIKTYLINTNLRKASALTPEIRQELIAFYRDDILELEKLIGRDLSHWLEVH